MFDVGCVSKFGLVTAAAVMVLMFSSCAGEAESSVVSDPVETEVVRMSFLAAYEVPTTEEFVVESDTTAESEPLWSDEELEAMVLTLAGECYDDKVHDKRLVCEVILNRVSTDGFGDSIIDVITAPHQFNGYWNQSRPVSDSDYEVAEKALEDWFNNGCEPLSEYLYFSAGGNRENVFRAKFAG